MTNNLKPCPFCGNEEPSLNSPNEHDTLGSINCPACMVVFPGAVGGPHREQELIDNWNTRAPSPERASETTYKVGRWLSAALEDDAVCQEMKDDIIAWMEAGRPNSHTSPEREALVRCVDDLTALQAFVGIMLGRGPDAIIPEFVNAPLGIPVRIGDLMRGVASAITQAKQALEEGDQ